MLLQVSDLSISFSSMYGQFRVLDQVSLDIGKGEIVGVVGESGSGKSVTALSILRILDKNASFDSGEILFNGENLLGLSEKKIQELRGKRIGMVFQEPMTALNPTMKVGKQLANVIKRHLNVSKKEANNLAVKALNDVKIKDPEIVFQKYPFQLSGGMRQRVVIALAMSAPPELLIADEPTTALDVTVQAEILKLMKDLSTNTGTSIMLISHDLGVVANICDRVNVMYGGKIVEKGTTKEVLFHPQHPYTQALIESLPEGKKKAQPLKVLSGESFSPNNRPNGCVFYDRCPSRTKRCHEEPAVVKKSESHWVSCWELENSHA